MDDTTFFEEALHVGVLGPVCMNCHYREGLARDSDFVLETAVRPDYLEVNRQTLTGLAPMQIDGRSVLLVKPTGGADHGGGVVIAADSPEYALLEDFLERLDSPVEDCPSDDAVYGAGLALLSPEETLRKASLLLVGQLPTDADRAHVRAGGEPALREALEDMVDDEAFVERAMAWFNDLLLTDKYLAGNEATDLLDAVRFPGSYWFSDLEATDLRYGDYANESLAREPLELLAHILRNDLPYTEILIADYTMVNAYTAQSYGVTGWAFPDPDDPAHLVYAPATLDDYPHAGVLTAPVFLNRYPSTATNRNRHRTWAFMKKFLATDLLLFAERPIDSSLSTTHNPTLNDPQCTVCHTVMDPIAGTFQNWNDDGDRAIPVDGWFPEMAIPGIGGEPLPASDRGRALAWMAGEAVNDARFAISAVEFVLHATTGLEPILPAAAETDEVLADAYTAQQEWILLRADAFRADDHDLEGLVIDTVMSRFFRAAEDRGAAVGDLEQAGTAKLLSPEELEYKIAATTGVHWSDAGGVSYLDSRYRMLYGGIDSDSVVERLTDPNGIMASLQLRMAAEVACKAVPRDLALPPVQRRILPFIEISYEPETVDGFVVPDVEMAIRQNLVHLHDRLLGESLAVDDPEIDASYALWRDTWHEGSALVDDGTVGLWLEWECRYTTWEGDLLPDEFVVSTDPDYTIRSWMAVVAYLLSDHRFLVE